MSSLNLFKTEIRCHCGKDMYGKRHEMSLDTCDFNELPIKCAKTYFQNLEVVPPIISSAYCARHTLANLGAH